MVVRPGLRVLSLCAGGGGLDLAVQLAIPGARTVCFVEREGFAVAHLVRAMGAGLLDQAPVWSDARTFDGRPWRGVVDCVLAGYPCTPFSLAGKREGARDPRHLWPHVRRIIVQCRPRYVFLENVGAHLSLGFEQVRGELCRLRFTLEAGLFAAAEVGAPHERERLFVLGLADPGCRPDERSGRSGELPGAAYGTGEPGRAPRDATRDGSKGAGHDGAHEPQGGALADPGCGGVERWGEPGDLPRPSGAGAGEGLQRERDGDAAGDGGADLERGMADAEHGGRQGRGAARGGATAALPRCGAVADAGNGFVPDPGRRSGGRAGARRPGAAGSGLDLVDADPMQRGTDVRREPDGASRALADGDGGGFAQRPEPHEPPADGDAAPRRGDAVGRDRAVGPSLFPPGGFLFPPGPADVERWRAVLAAEPTLAPSRAVFAEVAEPGLRRVADGMADRVDRLRLLGGGVVPLQGAYALRTLASRAAAAGAPGAAELVRMMGGDE